MSVVYGQGNQSAECGGWEILTAGMALGGTFRSPEPDGITGGRFVSSPRSPRGLFVSPNDPLPFLAAASQITTTSRVITSATTPPLEKCRGFFFAPKSLPGSHRHFAAFFQNRASAWTTHPGKKTQC